MKYKKLYLLLLAVFILFSTTSIFAQSNIDIFAPPGSGAPTDKLGDYINALYKFALLVGGIMAFGAVVYGGVKYIFAAGNPSGQSEGKDWIKSALLGLFLLAGAYLILNTINPDIVGLNLPSLSSFTLPPPPDNGGGGPPSGVVRQSTLDEIARLRQYCETSSCPVQINSTTGGSHAGGVCSHANGYKADIQNSDCINNCIRNGSNFSSLPDRQAGQPCYKDNASGNTYVYEPSTTGGQGHWDMNSCHSLNAYYDCR